LPGRIGAVFELRHIGSGPAATDNCLQGLGGMVRSLAQVWATW
jgi:hypothetical protein